MNGQLARWWMEEASARLQGRIPALGAVMQDGGMASDDLTAGMPDQNWAELAKEFFLS
jgi:hypothetical protein